MPQRGEKMGMRKSKSCIIIFWYDKIHSFVVWKFIIKSMKQQFWSFFPFLEICVEAMWRADIVRKKSSRRGRREEEHVVDDVSEGFVEGRPFQQ